MNFPNLKYHYTTAYTPAALKNLLQDILQERLPDGRPKSTGEIGDTTFRIKRIVTRQVYESFIPVLNGTYHQAEHGSKVSIAFYPGKTVCFLELGVLLMVILFIATPGAPINGESADLNGRLLFGILFMTLWSLMLLIVSYGLMLTLKEGIEGKLGLRGRREVVR